MTYDEKRGKYVVRWRENGRRRVRRFEKPEEAEALERTLAARAPVGPGAAELGDRRARTAPRRT